MKTCDCNNQEDYNEFLERLKKAGDTILIRKLSEGEVEWDDPLPSLSFIISLKDNLIFSIIKELSVQKFGKNTVNADIICNFMDDLNENCIKTAEKYEIEYGGNQYEVLLSGERGMF